MKRFLPIFLIIFFLFFTAISPGIASAQTQLQPLPNVVPTGGLWVVDPEVTFIGKNAARSGLMLNWTLSNYQWVCVNKVANRSCDNSNNPIAKFWGTIVLFIVVPLLFVVILATAIVIIITRGKSLTIMRFIPRFVAVVLLIVFSYSILQFLYQFTDLIQGFFLQSQPNGGSCPPNCISDKDLLYVGWDYRNFIGLRLLGDYNAESAFISLLLTKLTALTYFVMVGILLMRKIILWFFIIVSPIFPLLLLYYPVRNTGKIWIGEFFRWLLYAPLFAIFLKGLVFMWRNKIPLVFTNPNIGQASGIIFPTAVNILLGGPQQFVTPNNSVNVTETFALYVVALIMLWCVILLPWILLQIFLDYAANFSPGDSAVMKTLVSLTNKQPPPITSPSPSPAKGGATLTLPFAKKYTIPVSIQNDFKPSGAAKEIIRESATSSRFAQPTFLPTSQVNAEVLNLAHLTIPSLRDIAKYETALMSRDSSQQQEVERVRETLTQIASPVSIEIREKLSQESKQGNLLAQSILSAVSSISQQSKKITTNQLQQVLQQIANPSSVTSVVNRERMNNIHEMLQKENKENNSNLAASLLSVTERTSASEIEKIREQLMQTQQHSNSISSSVISQISNSQQSSENVGAMRNALKKIANPSQTTNAVEREHFSKLHDALLQESQTSNNQLAASILSVNDTTSEKELKRIREQIGTLAGNPVFSRINNTVQTSQVKQVLQQIANPTSIMNTVDREKYSKLHDMLVKESKENNNQLATSILSVTDKTSLTELEKIHDQLMQSKDSTIASTVMSTINNVVQQMQTTTRTKNVLQQVANPQKAANPLDREKLSKLHESLSKASQEGNELAKSILSVNEKTSIEEIEKLREKIIQAKEKGQPLANQLSELEQEPAVSVPLVNRVQTVTQDDYQVVKDMWKDNYRNLQVPDGMAGTRSEWITDDIAKIDEIVNMLSSIDQEKVNKGLAEVSNILPFLLVGGFSQSEIIAYLKAKQDAAKEIAAELAVEEEEKVTVEVKHTTAAQTMAVEQIEEPSSVAPTRDESSFSAPEVTTALPIAQTKQSQPEVSNEIFAMVNLKIPRMRDIAKYETGLMKKDGFQTAEAAKVKQVLEQIANPAQIGMAAEKERFEKLRERLVEESQNGNTTADSILSAAINSTKKSSDLTATPSDIKTVLQQIADPNNVSSSAKKEQYTKIHDALVKENTDLAKKILSVSGVTTGMQVQEIADQLLQSKQEGNNISSSILTLIKSFVKTRQVKNILQQLVDPASILSSVDRTHYTKLHDELIKARQQGNQLAEAILSTKEETSAEEVEKLHNKLEEAQKTGEPIAKTVLANITDTGIAPTNRVQPVTQEEFEEVRKMWEDNYRNLSVPTGFTDNQQGKIDWITKDSETIHETIDLLQTPDTEKRNEGLKKVATILPFLLLGGFSYQEMIGYLQAKLEAAKTVLTGLRKDESQKETVETPQQKQEQAKEMVAEEETDSK